MAAVQEEPSGLLLAGPGWLVRPRHHRPAAREWTAVHLGRRRGHDFPWFSGLFDRNYYENPVDIFFNLLLVLSLPLGLFAAWRYRSIRRMGLDKRPRRARIIREIRLGVVAILVIFVGLLFNPHSEAYTQYVDIAEARLAAEATTAAPARAVHVSKTASRVSRAPARATGLA